MKFVAVFASPEGVFWNDLFATVRATQVKNLVIIKDNFNITTDLEELGLRRTYARACCLLLLLKKLFNEFKVVIAVSATVLTISSLVRRAILASLCLVTSSHGVEIALLSLVLLLFAMPFFKFISSLVIGIDIDLAMLISTVQTLAVVVRDTRATNG